MPSSQCRIRPRHRIRPRRAAALASVAALTLAVSASGAARLPAGTTTAGPAAPARAASLGSCALAGEDDVQMSEGLRTAPGYARSTGTVRALTLMIDFSDAPGEGTAMDRFREFFPQTRKWFATSSYGRLDYRPATPVRHWLRMPKPFKAYGIERGAPFEPAYRDLVEDLVAEADPEVDFRSYDLLNVLVTPNAGPSALDTVLSVTFAGNADAPVADGVPVANASFVYSRQDDGSGSYGSTGYRVLPHENGHVFGLPDLYTQDGGGSVGHWDIMSEDWGAGNDLLGWHKWKLGWLTDTQVRCAAGRGSSEYTLTPLARAGGVKLVVVPLGERTGYALELRTQEGNDAAVCRPGILVYRVDADVDTGNGPVTVRDARRDSGGCTRSPNVQAELSDAAFTPGDTFRDPTRHLTMTVLPKDRGGNYRIRVTRG
ncbi:MULTISPECIES: M6 family metalloprotease domain-containing protein [Streptomyces]|uniref:M6 family metalloprotease domain-containing protein n=2 Tax=Streptomyces griseoaurantiacus TaxID=68213 RepID=A0ABZ1V3D1_9ACTN|nr:MULTISPECIES: M6 family metalloprotease domain-containing protein [Streptomyces]MBA5226053.1 M6 family metalloprotease domain-containing protein [Streptomyces griseoaurantiacus]MDX3089115.1 M6 family metalloprotease domain-containing protein [Streptomyces sp. ME12-02E]MDX3330295.1 M6 family metalloprotease domain-containing protein [Streptomyces sp. ME02-6978a]WTI27359.1 M6 family metalloprotease domain-containing protein [Streptomyces jietaisiensis]GHE55138.1 M6 family metalloprotease doma